MKLSKNAQQQADMIEEVIHDLVDSRRRSFIRRGSVAAIAAASLPIIGSGLVSCSDDSTTAPVDDTVKKRDISIVTDAYLLEKLAVNTYVYAAGSGILTGAYLAVGQSFAEDHTGHAATFLSILTSQLGGTKPTDPTASENLTTGIMVNGTTKFKIAPSIAFTDPVSIFRYALAVELTAAQAYVVNATAADMNMRLSNKAAMEAMVDIAPVEAEHAAVFRAALKLLEMQPTDADAGSNIGRSIQPTSKLSAEVPKP